MQSLWHAGAALTCLTCTVALITACKPGFAKLEKGPTFLLENASCDCVTHARLRAGTRTCAHALIHLAGIASLSQVANKTHMYMQPLQTGGPHTHRLPRWQKGNKTLISLCPPRMEEGKYNSCFCLPCGNGRRKKRALLPFVFPSWKNRKKTLTSLCLPELEEGK